MLLGVAEAAKSIGDLVGVEPSLVAKILWGLLLAGLFCASIHLVSMLVTRWGDDDPSRKSLVFSILVHVSCALGLVAVAPLPAIPDTVEQEVQVDVQRQLVDADENAPELDPGNTPVWQQVPDQEQVEVDRIPAMPPELVQLATPERDAERPELNEPELPDVYEQPQEPTARPEPLELAERGPRQRADVPLDVEDPQAELRQETRVPTTSRLRRPQGRAGLRPDPSVERTATRGQVQRPVPRPAPLAEPRGLKAPVLAARGIKRAVPGNVIRRREGPAPGTTDLQVPGSNSSKATSGAAAGSPAPRQFTRLRRRRPGGQADGVITRTIPSVAASTPTPRPGPTRGVRDGVDSRRPLEGLRPNLVRPDVAASPRRRELSLPATYRLRNLSRRREVAQKFGGTEASELAVETSLAWLARHQHPDGYWDSNGFSVHCPRGDRCQDHGGRGLHGDTRRSEPERRAGLHADAGITALSLLAFLGAGYTHEEGQYAERIGKTIDWLILQQRRDGYLGGKATRYARHYCHAMAAYALAEAYGMQPDKALNPRLRAAVALAVKYIVSQQNPDDGGWRYVKGQQSDMSMFGWQLMALKSAEIAGLKVPERSKDLMMEFLNARSRGRFDGLAGYRPTEEVSPAMTAEALFSKQMMGIKRDHAASRQAAGFLSKRLPRLSETNLYYWYYGTLAMYQYGGEPWERWNSSLRNLLVATQRRDGHSKGSWDPRGPWGPHGGRIYSTALGTLCLEVYYRFLPLYQIGDRKPAIR